MRIYPVETYHLDQVLDIERLAFGEPDEAELVRNLLADPTARPCISLLAEVDDRPVGHILLTRATLRECPDSIDPVECMILAPLAVIPDYQQRGVGQSLIRRALDLARNQGVGLVFVLGDPGYYPKAGFRSGAGPLGFPAPYPLPPEHTDAWMVQELRPGLIGYRAGEVSPAETMMRPELWRE